MCFPGSGPLHPPVVSLSQGKRESSLVLWCPNALLPYTLPFLQVLLTRLANLFAKTLLPHFVEVLIPQRGSHDGTHDGLCHHLRNQTLIQWVCPLLPEPSLSLQRWAWRYFFEYLSFTEAAIFKLEYIYIKLLKSQSILSAFVSRGHNIMSITQVFSV